MFLELEQKAFESEQQVNDIEHKLQNHILNYNLRLKNQQKTLSRQKMQMAAQGQLFYSLTTADQPFEIITRAIFEKKIEDFKSNTRDYIIEEVEDKLKELKQDVEIFGRDEFFKCHKKIQDYEIKIDNKFKGYTEDLTKIQTIIQTLQDGYESVLIKLDQIQQESSAQIKTLEAKVDETIIQRLSHIESEIQELSISNKSVGSNESKNKFVIKSIDKSKQQFKIPKHNIEAQEAKFNEKHDKLLKYLEYLQEDLMKIRDSTFANCKNLEEKFQQEIEEHQMTVNALFVQKSELGLKMQNLENKVRKWLNMGEKTVVRRASIITRNQNVFTNNNRSTSKRRCSCGNVILPMRLQSDSNSELNNIKQPNLCIKCEREMEESVQDDYQQRLSKKQRGSAENMITSNFHPNASVDASDKMNRSLHETLEISQPMISQQKFRVESQQWNRTISSNMVRLKKVQPRSKSRGNSTPNDFNTSMAKANRKQFLYDNQALDQKVQVLMEKIQMTKKNNLPERDYVTGSYTQNNSPIAKPRAFVNKRRSQGSSYMNLINNNQQQ